MKFGGFTTSLVTPLEYEKASKKHHALTRSLLTILMLFFMIDPADYINSSDSTKESLTHAAGYAGMTYAAMSSMDGFLRPKFPSLRIFDEVSIVGAYTSLWTLMGVVFERAAMIYAIVCGGLTVVGFYVLNCYYGITITPNPKLKNKRTTDFITAIASSGSPAAENALTTMALFALVNNLHDPATAAIVEAAMNVIHAAPAPAPAANAQGPCGGCCGGCCGLFAAPGSSGRR